MFDYISRISNETETELNRRTAHVSWKLVETKKGLEDYLLNSMLAHVEK